MIDEEKKTVEKIKKAALEEFYEKGVWKGKSQDHLQKCRSYHRSPVFSLREQGSTSKGNP